MSGLSGKVALTMSLARDYGPEGIRVNELCPGWVDTPMLGPGATLLADGGQAIVDVGTVAFAPR